MIDWCRITCSTDLNLESIFCSIHLLFLLSLFRLFVSPLILFCKCLNIFLHVHLFRVWNYEEGTLLNNFDNHDYPDKGISKLCLVNEHDDDFLLVASSIFHTSGLIHCMLVSQVLGLMLAFY